MATQLDCNRCGSDSGYVVEQSDSEKLRVIDTNPEPDNNDKFYYCSECWIIIDGKKLFGVE